MTLHLSFLSMYKSRNKSSFWKLSYGPCSPKLGLPMSFFFSFSLLFSLCSSFRMTPWNTGALLAFCVNQRRSSLFLFSLFFLLYFLIVPPRTIRFQSIIRPVSSFSCRRRPSWRYPRILLGLDPDKFLINNLFFFLWFLAVSLSLWDFNSLTGD